MLFNRERHGSKCPGEGRFAKRTQGSSAKAPSPTNQFLPQRRWDAEGVIETPRILPRRTVSTHKAFLKNMILCGTDPAYSFGHSRRGRREPILPPRICQKSDKTRDIFHFLTSRILSWLSSIPKPIGHASPARLGVSLIWISWYIWGQSPKFRQLTFAK